ncbi:hypothetical protein [Lentibacillus cibarius]|uniref:Sulfurtransferase n=2 Tax=Lentibacillus cibarius TaxID=2583219 RepID=A0A5S3QNG1_9BACI|nr:hypothetical protein [Lentibacillus cibarius]TMN23329.1 hypothetical protein FFL34_15435 [Lentibacillus cibarius]
MILAFALILTTLLVFIYRRYIPVGGIENMPLHSVSWNHKAVVFVDTRDFQLSSRDPIECAYQLPIPYLKRYIHEIPSDKPVVIIASDYKDKNLGARFLKKKGINIIGYHMLKEERKGDYDHAI